MQSNSNILFCRSSSFWWVGLSCHYSLLADYGDYFIRICTMLYQGILLLILQRRFVIQNIVLSNISLWQLGRKVHSTSLHDSWMHLKITCDFPTETSNWSFLFQERWLFPGASSLANAMLWMYPLSHLCSEYIQGCCTWLEHSRTIPVVADCFSSAKDVV